MSKVIARTETKYVETPLGGIVCDTCGGGWTNRDKAEPCDRIHGRRYIPDPKDPHGRGPMSGYMLDPNGPPGVKCTGTMYPDERVIRERVPGTITIECDCGAHVEGLCRDFTITCGRCGADFNGSGQRLADRSQWGEETGETYVDIVGPGSDFEGDDFGGDY